MPTTFKPFNVQYTIDDEETAYKLLEIATKLGNRVGDRRIGGSAAAKEIVLRVLQAGTAEELLRLQEQVTARPAKGARRPKSRRGHPPQNQGAT